MLLFFCYFGGLGGGAFGVSTATPCVCRQPHRRGHGCLYALNPKPYTLNPKPGLPIAQVPSAGDRRKQKRDALGFRVWGLGFGF